MSRRSLQNGGGLHFPQGSSPRDDRRRGSEEGGGTNSRSSSSRGPRVRFPDDLREGEDSSGPLEFVADLVTALLAVGCVGGLLTILCVLYVTVRRFSLPAYRRLSSQLGVAAFVDALALLLPNTRLYLTGDSDVPSPVGTSLLVSNHIFNGDWWALLGLGRCVGLRGSIKVFLRNEYLHVNVNTASSGSGSSGRSSSNGSGLPSSTSVSTPTVSTPGSNGMSFTSAHLHNPQDLSLIAKVIHLLLDFPLVDGDDYVTNRTELNQLLRSFAEEGGASAPVHLLFFPEGWCQYNGADRRSVLGKSNEFANREGRPQLKHLLLPRSRGFNASLECLRESSPVVYDVTMACNGYDGSLPPSIGLNVISLWRILRRKFPGEIHVRIKRYSMEEVLQDSSWLDKKWAEKDRLLSHFARHQSFPADGRGYCRHRVFSTRHHSLENSTVSMMRLLLLPCTVPVLLLLSIPLFWTMTMIWVVHQVFRLFFREDHRERGADSTPGSVEGSTQTPGSNSAGTPFLPATPFGSPSISSWRDLFTNRDE